MEFLKFKFPQGLRVLAVDDSVLLTTALSAHFAYDLLRKKEKRFDIVITDAETEDGFRLLEIIGLEMDIPVIMMTTSNDRRRMMKGIEHGACGYLVKPPSLKEIQNIWQYVLISKNKSTLSDLSNQTKSNEFSEMNVPGLTRDHVASHLQKYRNILEKPCQKPDYITADSGMSGHKQQNSIFLSFDKLHFKNRMKKYLHGLTSHGPGTNQSSHHGVTPNASGSNHSFGLNPQPHFPPSAQQYTSPFSAALGTVNQNHQKIQVPDSTMQNLQYQTHDSGLNAQPFSSSSKLFDPYTVSSSKLPDYNTNIDAAVSDFQFGEASNVLPSNNLFNDLAYHPPVTGNTSSKIVVETSSKLPDHNAKIDSRESNFQFGETSNVLPNNNPIGDLANHPPTVGHKRSYSKLNTVFQNDDYSFNMTDHSTLPGYDELGNTVAPTVPPSTNVMESQRVDQISWPQNPLTFLKTGNINYHLGGYSSGGGDELGAVIRPQQFDITC
ncbi:hypothetical protein MKX01_033384 [Papaver californicum]|nr:hypothetical protein MKX01_033384 [Papaver californicum]